MNLAACSECPVGDHPQPGSTYVRDAVRVALERDLGLEEVEARWQRT